MKGARLSLGNFLVREAALKGARLLLWDLFS